jgi:hypothetical protein
VRLRLEQRYCVVEPTCTCHDEQQR